MSIFQPIPFEGLIKRVFYEYKQHNKILGLSKEKFFLGFPGGYLGVHYMGKKASTPLGPAAGPHTQLAQNLVLVWLTGSRIMELRTVQALKNPDVSHPSIDTENIGFNIEHCQELKLEDSLKEYVKAWMLIEMIKRSELLGEEFSRHGCDTIFDLSIGSDFKGIKSEQVQFYIRKLKNAQKTIDALREEIPADFSEFKDIEYDPHIINSVTLSTFHGCPAEEVDHIVSHLITEHQLNVTVRLNPTLLGQEELSHILYDLLGYKELGLHPEAFERDLTFDQALEIIRHTYGTASSFGKSVGLKLTNTLGVKNHKGYLTADVMNMSGPPLFVLAIQLLKKTRDALKDIQLHIPIAFSGGIDDKNFADMLSANLTPVTVCTDLLKDPGYEKCLGYLNDLGKKMQTAGAINIPDYIMKRFGNEVAAIRDVFAKLRDEVRHLGQKLPKDIRETNIQSQLQIFEHLEERVLKALKENSDSLELLTTDAIIITDTLKDYTRKFGESFLMPHTFKELYLNIISAAAERNLNTLIDQTMQDSRYTYEHNRHVPDKLQSDLGLYDCESCDRCVAVCPNNANFIYHLIPAKTNYVNYQLTEDGVKEVDGGQFVIKKSYQIGNFDDCCNECSVCAIYCPEQGKPYTAKPKYFGSRERWETHKERDGFFVEKVDDVESIAGRIDGQEYTLRHDTTSIQITFSDGVIEALFEYPDNTLIKTNILASEKTGHILDMRAYHILLTQLTGVLNDEDYNYLNIKYL